MHAGKSRTGLSESQIGSELDAQGWLVAAAKRNDVRFPIVPIAFYPTKPRFGCLGPNMAQPLVALGKGLGRLLHRLAHAIIGLPVAAAGPLQASLLACNLVLLSIGAAPAAGCVLLGLGRPSSSQLLPRKVLQAAGRPSHLPIQHCGDIGAIAFPL